MAYPTIRVTGNVIDGSGNGVAGGTIQWTLDQPAAVADVTTDLVGGEFVVAIAADGSVDFNIMANDQTSPATTWIATYRPDNQPPWQKYYAIDLAGGDRDIGALPEVEPPPVGGKLLIVSDENDLPPAGPAWEGYLAYVRDSSGPHYWLANAYDGVSSWDWGVFVVG